MTEPFYIVQTAEPMTWEQRRQWARNRAAEAFAEGAVVTRASTHETIEHLTLVEGWKKRPKDQGEPRWSLAPKEPTNG